MKASICFRKKKSVGSNSGSNPVAPKLAGNSGTGQGNKSSNSEYVAAISRPATCKSGMETTAATTAAMQLLSKGSVSSTPATAALNLRKLSIKSASSINNVTPAVKRRKSSKRSGGGKLPSLLNSPCSRGAQPFIFWIQFKASI